MTPLAEGPRAAAFKVTLTPEFHEPAGSTHDYDQVVIARGVKHESKNPTGKPIDLVIVGIK